MKSNLLLALLFISIPARSLAAADAQKQFLSLPQKSGCMAKVREIEAWKLGRLEPLPKEKVDSALKLLNSLSYPSRSDVAAVDAATHSNIAANYYHFIRVTTDECNFVRFHLIKPLILFAESAGSTDADKKRIHSDLLKALREIKFNTAITAFVETSNMAHAFNSKLFNPSLEDKKSYTLFRNENFKKAEKILAKLKSTPGTMGLGGCPSQQECENIILKNKLGDLLVEQNTEATRLLTQIREFASKLN